MVDSRRELRDRDDKPVNLSIDANPEGIVLQFPIPLILPIAAVLAVILG